MKFFIPMFFLCSTGLLYAEGIASMTDVTRDNAKRLDHHALAVVRKSEHGKSYLALIIRPEKEHPLVNCSVTIYDKSGKKILLQVDPVIGRVPKLKDGPDGSRVTFRIADEWIDGVEIRYHLHANEFQSHVFTIPRGQLAKVANL